MVISDKNHFNINKLPDKFLKVASVIVEGRSVSSER